MSSPGGFARLILLVLAALALFACSPSTPSSTPHPSPRHSSSPAPITTPSPDSHFCAAQVEPPGAPGHFIRATPSSFTLLGCDWTLKDAALTLSGTWTYASGDLTLNAKDGPCANRPGLYTWDFKSTTSTLTLTLVSDSCASRSRALTSAPWTFQP